MTAGGRISLAHAREDKAQLRKLYGDLKSRGFEPWLDEFDLVPRQIRKDEIAKAIRQAAVFLACLSSRSAKKAGYVPNEFRQALSAFGERPRRTGTAARGVGLRPPPVASRATIRSMIATATASPVSRCRAASPARTTEPAWT